MPKAPTPTTPTEKYEVRNRWNNEVQFTAEISCAPDASPWIKLGLAVRWGYANGARLVGASLDGAILVGASLVGAILDGAILDGASLVGARLDGARLVGASLDGASLDGAILDGAILVGASLVGAILDGAILDGASLDGARLVGARLVGASLDGASLDGARLDGAILDGAILDGARLVGAILDGAILVGASLVGAIIRDRNGRDIKIQRAPLQLSGLYWFVTIWDAHMQIGCELHSLTEWAEFDDRRILCMDRGRALNFWRQNKEALLGLARADGRSFEPIAAEETELVKADA